MSDQRQVTGDRKLCTSQSRCSFAFTLIELLVVIAILGILAGLAVPALKNLGKSNTALSASRQLLDDLAHARQLAVSGRTTVYMVFVPTNFWNNLTYNSSGAYNNWLTALTSAQKTALTNLVDKQLTGYTFIASGALGDQPGRHVWHYLAPWQNLPAGTFISAQKFAGTNTIVDPISNVSYPIAQFKYPVAVPFPTEQSPNPIYLPCVAFDYSGRLVSEIDASGNYHDAYIPLVQGSVSYGIDPTTKSPQLAALSANSITETPPGNSTGIAYNIIHIDALTGRAVLEFHKIGP